jgi:hypothetical protein
MGKIGRRVDGEKHMTTADVRQLLDDAKLLGDDGTALFHAKGTSVGGKVLNAWVVVDPASILSAAEDWERWSRMPPPELAGEMPELDYRAPELDPAAVAALTAGDEEVTGQTMEIPAAAAIPPPARQQQRGARHRRQ